MKLKTITIFLVITFIMLSVTACNNDTNLDGLLGEMPPLEFHLFDFNCGCSYAQSPHHECDDSCNEFITIYSGGVSLHEPIEVCILTTQLRLAFSWLGEDESLRQF
jgi:hypothetical protein